MKQYVHLPAHHHQAAHHHQCGGDVQANTGSLCVYYAIRALTRHAHYTHKLLVGLDKIEWAHSYSALSFQKEKVMANNLCESNV